MQRGGWGKDKADAEGKERREAEEIHREKIRMDKSVFCAHTYTEIIRHPHRLANFDTHITCVKCR